VFLPEASDFIARNSAEAVKIAHEEGIPGRFLEGLKEQAKESNVHVTAGVHWPATPTQCSNVAVWIDPAGNTQHYKKLHLFDVDIKGGAFLMESKSTLKGDKVLPPFDTPLGKVGLAICYDVGLYLISFVFLNCLCDCVGSALIY